MILEIPSTKEAEERVLGACLKFFDAVNYVTQKLTDQHFEDAACRTIFQSVANVQSKGIAVNWVSVTEDMHIRGILDPDKASYVARLESLGGYDEKHFCDILHDGFLRRSMVSCANTHIRKACSPKELAEETLEAFQASLLKINQASDVESFSAKEITEGKHREDGKPLMKMIDEIMEANALGLSTLPGISTGWKKMDEIIGGLVDGHLVIIGARPGVGKTTFCCNLALSIAVKQNIPIGFFSLEMSPQELTLKLISNLSSTPYQKIIKGQLSATEYQHFVGQAIAKMQESETIFIESQPNMSIGVLKTRALRLKEVYGVKAIFIDYLGYVTCNQFEGNKVEQISFISKELKMLARSLKIPVICICQLNRQSDTEKRHPRISDLRDSGQIEANADEVILLHRPDTVDPYDKPGRILAIIGKNRYGSQATLEGAFTGATGQINFDEPSISTLQKADNIEEFNQAIGIVS